MKKMGIKDYNIQLVPTPKEFIKFCFKFGFTMAEAILVMTILGIIATVMITVMKPAQYKEKALKIKTTKVINDIDQATEFILLNHSKDGTIEHFIAEDGSEFSVCDNINKIGADKFTGLYKKYMQTSRKECNSTKCSCYTMGESYNRANRNYFYLKDDSCIGISTMPKGNWKAIFPSDNTEWSMASGLKNVCGALFVDVNGEEGPNVYGKDKFLLKYTNYGLAWDAEIAEGESSEDGEL